MKSDIMLHMNNSHTVTIANLMDAFLRYGYNVRTVPDSEFRETLAEAGRHEEKTNHDH